MSNSKRVEFRAEDGVILRGDFYQAEGENRPIAVMTAGLALLKEHFIDTIARRYQAAGISALAFDYRNWGSSDGSPRHDTDLLKQGDDYRDAVSAAKELPGVDPDKVIIFGIGHGGAGAIIAAADDPRPAAVILHVPIVSGRNDAKAYPEGLLDRAWRDREEKTRTGDTEPTYIQAWPETLEQARGESGGPILLGMEPAFHFWQEAKPRSDAAGTPYDNKITLRSLLYTARTEPKDWLYKITQPTLYVVTPFDPFTGTAEYHRAAFERMGPNAEFKIVEPPANASFDEFISYPVEAQIEFLKRVL